MRLKPYVGLSLALIFVFAAYQAIAQTSPAAREAKLPLAIGAGFSGYNPDWGHTHLLGGTLWIDYTPSRVPAILHGIGIEVELRDLNYGRSSATSPNLREDAAGGGVIYSWPRCRSFRPYGKFEMGLGNIDDESKTLTRSHDSRTITSVGGGMEFRASRYVWIRTDYEYQFWPDMIFKYNKPTGAIHPQGFTIGALYHFSRPHFH